MNSGKEIFFQNINDAFIAGDAHYISQYLSEDIVWNMVGDRTVSGKENVLAFFTETGDMPQKMMVSNIVTQEISGVVEGTFELNGKNGEVQRYAFCDIYKLDSLHEDAKIKSLTSYVIASIKEDFTS